MGIWTFVLTETPDGYADHANHHSRRKIAWQRAAAAGILRVSDTDQEGDVRELQYPNGGVWNYTWMVNDPTDFHVFGSVKSFEAQVPQSVYCSSGPTRVLAPAEWGALQLLSVKLGVDDSKL